MYQSHSSTSQEDTTDMPFLLLHFSQEVPRHYTFQHRKVMVLHTAQGTNSFVIQYTKENFRIENTRENI